MEGHELGIKQQALIALIPGDGFLAILIIGGIAISKKRGGLAAFAFCFLCAFMFVAYMMAFVLTMLVVDMPRGIGIAFIVIGSVMMCWGISYITLGIEAAFLRGKEKPDTEEDDQSN